MSESLILGFIYNFILRFVEYYKYSATHKLLDFISIRLKRLFKGSLIWGFIKSNERSSGFFEKSLFLKLLQLPFDLFLSLIRKVYGFVVQPCKNSIAYILIANSWSGKLAGILFRRFELILGLFIFIQTIAPHEYWVNKYVIAIIFFITLLYIIKAAGDVRYGLDIKRVDIALILFILAVIISAVTSITLKSSILALVVNGMSFLLVFLMVNTIKSKHDIGRIIYFIIAGVTIASIYGMWQWLNHIPVDPLLTDVNFSPGVSRAFSTMANPNNYAEYLLLTIPFYGAAFFNAKSSRGKFIILALSALPLFNMFLTSSRSGWLAFAVAMLVYLFFKNRKLVPVVIILGIVAIPFIPSAITDRLSTIGKDTSSLTRIPIWESSLRMLKDYWTTGVGLGAQPFLKLFGNYSASNTFLRPPAHSHMLPLQIWLETGALGILSFIWFIVRMVKKGAISIFGKKDAYVNNIIIACISAFTGILLMGAVEYVWFYPRILSMFWIVAGIFLSAVNILRIRPFFLVQKD